MTKSRKYKRDFREAMKICDKYESYYLMDDKRNKTCLAVLVLPTLKNIQWLKDGYSFEDNTLIAVSSLYYLDYPCVKDEYREWWLGFMKSFCISHKIDFPNTQHYYDEYFSLALEDFTSAFHLRKFEL